MKKHIYILVFLTIPFWSVAQECDDAPIITQEPESATVVENGTVQFSIEAIDYSKVYWFRSTGNNSSTLISNNDVYSGARTTTLTLNNVPAEYDGYAYYAYILDDCRESDSSSYATLSVLTYAPIPDANFEAALEALGYDDISGDGQVPIANIQNVTELNMNSKSIDYLTGIEYFTELTELSASSNNLTTIDITHNTKLITVNLNSNDLLSIDIATLTNLEDLSVNSNDIITLDVSNNTNLTEITCYGNQLTNLDLTGLANLEEITCSSMKTLTSLTLTGTTNLLEINAFNSGISTIIDISDAAQLEDIYLNDNNLNTIDLSNNASLKLIYLGNNALTSVDLRNGNNQNITTFDITENSNLTCVSVDDISYIKSIASFDTHHSFTTDCNSYTAIKDPNFESALSNLDDVGNDGQVPTSAIQSLLSLDVSNANINNISGIEAFTSLVALDVSDNNLTSIDVSNNTSLSELNTQNNQLGILNLSLLTNLISLNASENQLFYLNIQNGNNQNITNFNATGNDALTCILVDDENATSNLNNIDIQTSFSDTDCTIYTQILDDNFEAALYNLGYDDIIGDGQVPKNSIYEITQLDLYREDISNATGIEDFALLEELNLVSNSITTLNLSNNTKLISVDIGNNDINTLNISNNAALETLDADSNELSSIDLSSCTNLKTIYLNNNLLTDLDVSTCTLLDRLECSNNSLTSLDLSNNSNLTILNVPSNSFTSGIDLSANTSLSTLDLGSCELTSINLHSNTQLIDLDIDKNQLTTIDLSNNTLLEDLYLEENQLTTIDISLNTALVNIDIGENLFTTLHFPDNSNLEDINAEENPLLTTVTFGELPALIDITIDDCIIETIDLSGLTNLNEIDLRDNLITYLDLSKNTALTRITLYRNELTYVNLKNGNSTNISRFYSTGNDNLTCVQVDDVEHSTNNWTTSIDDHTSFSEDCGYEIIVAPEVILEGAFALDTGTIVMHDNLRDNTSVLIPETSPYNASETCEPSVFETTGENAIVDWIQIQLRAADDISEIVATKSALLLRNGKIVSTDGVSNVAFTEAYGNYYIAIAHRNHLTIASNATYTLTGTITNIDFSNTSNVYEGTSALTDLGNGYYGIPLGDIDENGQIQNTDSNAVVTQIGISGYSTYDVDLNGQVQNTDINIILQNVGKGVQF